MRVQLKLKSIKINRICVSQSRKSLISTKWFMRLQASHALWKWMLGIAEQRIAVPDG